MGRMKSCDGSDSSTSAHSSGANSNGMGGRKNRTAKLSAGEAKKSLVSHEDVYDYSGKKGHWARDCHKKKRDEEAHALVAHGKEEEQSLLMEPRSSPMHRQLGWLHHVGAWRSWSSRSSPTFDHQRSMTTAIGCWTWALPTI
jgi:hypothetical protein